MFPEVHTGEVQKDEFGGYVDHIEQVSDERVAPLLVQGKSVVTEVQVLNLRAILVNHLH